jgi:hypothetical protein
MRAAPANYDIHFSFIEYSHAKEAEHILLIYMQILNWKIEYLYKKWLNI